MAIWLTRLGSFIDRNGWDMYYACSTIILIDGRYLLMYNRGEGKLRAAKREISPWIHWLLVLAMITDLDYVVGVWEITVITEQKGWVTWLISGNTGTDPVAFYLSLDLEFQYSFMRTFSFYSFEPHFQNCIFFITIDTTIVSTPLLFILPRLCGMRIRADVHWCQALHWLWLTDYVILERQWKPHDLRIQLRN